jgi:hypothetical protein
MVMFIFCLFWLGQDKVSPVQNQTPAHAQQQSTPTPSSSVDTAETGQAGSAKQDQAKAASWSDPLVILNFALFAAVLIQAGIYWKQFRKMEATLGEIKNQGKTLRRQAIAALSQARSMREALIASEKAEEKRLLAMQGQWQAMNLALDEQRKLVAQNERAVKAAEDNVKTVEKTSVYANRAYVVAKVRGVYNVSYQFKIWIQNLGNTPANDVYVAYAYGVREEPPHKETPENLIVYDIGFTETESLGLIASDGSHETFETPRVELSDADNERLYNGELKLYCWGRINYEDIFNRKWHTDFCFEAWKNLSGANPCKHGNAAI